MTTTSLPLRVHPDVLPARQGRLRTFFRKLRVLGLRGVGLVLLNRVTGRVSLVPFDLPGLPHATYLRIGTGDFAEYWRIFEDLELDFELTNPRVIVDAGGRAGLSAAWFASRYPGATIYAVEMERSNFAVLDLNSAPYLNIVPVRAAIAGQLGKLSIPSSDGGHVGVNLGDTPDGEQFVTGITVSRLLDHYSADSADLLKLTQDDRLTDEVLEDCPNWLQRVAAVALDADADDNPLSPAATLYETLQQRGRTRLYSR